MASMVNYLSLVLALICTSGLLQQAVGNAIGYGSSYGGDFNKGASFDEIVKPVASSGYGTVKKIVSFDQGEILKPVVHSGYGDHVASFDHIETLKPVVHSGYGSVNKVARSGRIRNFAKDESYKPAAYSNYDGSVKSVIHFSENDDLKPVVHSHHGGSFKPIARFNHDSGYNTVRSFNDDASFHKSQY